MRVLENLQNHILSLQSLKDELINTDVLNAMVDLMKTLPTRDFEYSFLADYFMVLVQILSSHKSFPVGNTSNLQLLLNRICDALKHHLHPFMIECGLLQLTDT